MADDLLVLARDGTAARKPHEHLKARLRAAGMKLKAAPQTAVRDLHQGDTGDWLGFRLCKGPGGLEVRPTDRCWAKLDEALELAHTKPAAPARALETIGGWTEQLGPCRPHLDIADFYARIASVAHRARLRRDPSRTYPRGPPPPWVPPVGIPETTRPSTPHGARSRRLRPPAFDDRLTVSLAARRFGASPGNFFGLKFLMTTGYSPEPAIGEFVPARGCPVYRKRWTRCRATKM